MNHIGGISGVNKVLADATCVLFLIRNGIDIITQLCYSLAFLKQRYDVKVLVVVKKGYSTVL